MPVHLHYFLNALKIEQARGKEKKKKKKPLTSTQNLELLLHSKLIYNWSLES